MNTQHRYSCLLKPLEACQGIQSISLSLQLYKEYIAPSSYRLIPMKNKILAKQSCLKFQHFFSFLYFLEILRRLGLMNIVPASCFTFSCLSIVSTFTLLGQQDAGKINAVSHCNHTKTQTQPLYQLDKRLLWNNCKIFQIPMMLLSTEVLGLWIFLSKTLCLITSRSFHVHGMIPVNYCTFLTD